MELLQRYFTPEEQRSSGTSECGASRNVLSEMSICYHRLGGSMTRRFRSRSTRYSSTVFLVGSSAVRPHLSVRLTAARSSHPTAQSDEGRGPVRPPCSSPRDTMVWSIDAPLVPTV